MYIGAQELKDIELVKSQPVLNLEYGLFSATENHFCCTASYLELEPLSCRYNGLAVLCPPWSLMLLSWRPNELWMPWRCETAWFAVLLQDRTHFYDFSINIYMGWVLVEGLWLNLCSWFHFSWLCSVVVFWINRTFDEHFLIISVVTAVVNIIQEVSFQITKRSLEKQYDQVVAGHHPPLYKKCCICETKWPWIWLQN